MRQETTGIFAQKQSWLVRYAHAVKAIAENPELEAEIAAKIKICEWVEEAKKAKQRALKWTGVWRRAAIEHFNDRAKAAGVAVSLIGEKARISVNGRRLTYFDKLELERFAERIGDERWLLLFGRS
jgi:hypothetical protein